MDSCGWSGHLVHAVREFAEMRQRELKEHMKAHEGDLDEQDWASKELDAINKLHSAAISYLDETGQ